MIGRGFAVLALLAALLLSAWGQAPGQGTGPQSTQTYTIYSGNDSADGLVSRQVLLQTPDAQALLDALIDAQAIPAGTSCLSFAQDEAADAGGEPVRTLTMDLSAEFGEGIRRMGTSGELIMLASLCNTFLEAYDAQQLRLTVEGQPLETGHAVYDAPLTAFRFA